MSALAWLMVFFAGLFLADALRLRGRISALKEAPEDGVEPDDLIVFKREGVEVDQASVNRAAAFMEAEGLDVVDLFPKRLGALEALAVGQMVELGSYRKDRLAAGRTAFHAIVARADTVVRAEIETGHELNPIELQRAAAELKRYASATTDFVVVDDLQPSPPRADQRLAMTRELIGGGTTPVLLLQMAMMVAMIFGLVFAPLWGAIATGIFHLQPAIALAGTRLAPGDLLLTVLLRLPLELLRWFGTAFGRWRHDEGDPIEDKRPEYEELLSGGDLSRFWLPRREDCPVCGSEDLSVHFRTVDLLQHKPGTFTVERCRDCSHLFQNPRLSIEGLNFYYKDFYDGLGEKEMEVIFSFSSGSYAGRAAMVKAEKESPGIWLDVGGGHGHFCNVARDHFPKTRFEALDLSESIDEAKRRGWADEAYLGLFPDLAPELAGKYDVVSMSHYLEHTLEPESEIEAASTALSPGGLLMIEVPNPESGFRKVLRRLWLPYFQPQHMHLLSMKNLETLLRRHGFEPVEWHVGEAHQRVDFFGAIVLLLRRLAPGDWPWRPRNGALGRLRRWVVWTLGAPFVPLAILLDHTVGVIAERTGLSNTYRVLARKSA